MAKAEMEKNPDPNFQETKKCRNCGESCLVSEFPYFSSSTAGRKNTCKKCSKTLSKLRSRLKKENKTPEPGPCPICGEHTSSWILDHCHFDDHFRGYICNSCNLGLGRFNDDIRILEKAIDYLRQNS